MFTGEPSEEKLIYSSLVALQKAQEHPPCSQLKQSQAFASFSGVFDIT